VSGLSERLRLDPYILALLGTVALASILPCRGRAAEVLGIATDLAIALLFFLYGARLSPQAVWAGLTHWRLQSVVFLATYALFPALALGLAWLLARQLGADLATGFVYLGLLPSTVQSSITMVSLANGNVAAAICAASISNVLGVFLTPLLVALVLSRTGGGSFAAIGDIVLHLLLPFFLGQLARPWLADWLVRWRPVLGFVDRGTILLVVYTAFSRSVVGGVWGQLSAGNLVALAGACVIMLGLVIALTMGASRALRLPRADEAVVVLCGSVKSLASGIPMATILFSGPVAGLVVLPLMLFHQLQLMVSAVLARRYAARGGEGG
jgi:sodium/bile acid cotransporter 7